MPEPEARLIEQWMPINEISVEAIREGGMLAGRPPVNQLHVWWARRPLITSRATIAASMLPVDADRDEFIANLGTSPKVVEAQNKINAVKAEDGWSNITFPNKRAFLHNPEFLTKDMQATPTVLDMTAGGGSIPFEAGRLGFQTIANELNPVASLILRATCEWPQTFGQKLLKDYQSASQRFQAKFGERLANIYPEEPQPDCKGGDCPHPQRYHCTENCPDPNSCTHPKTGSKNHETVCAQRYAQTYLWARTVKCPACNNVIPLSPNWKLDNKGTGIRLELHGQECRFRIVHDRSTCRDCKKNDSKKPCNTATLHSNGEISAGTTARAVAVCLQTNCGTTTQKGYLAKEAQAGRYGPSAICRHLPGLVDRKD